MRRYRGLHPELDELAHKGTVTVHKPSDLTAAQHAMSVRNAITHISRSRGKKFKTRVARHGAVVVTRVYTETETIELLDKMGF